jgi:hypothetical protein
VLAFISEGLAETSLIAIVLAIEPAFVATHPVPGIVVILLAGPPVWQVQAARTNA